MGKHLPKASSSFGLPFKRIFLLIKAADKILLLRKKTEPGFRVRRDMNVRLADKAVLDFERSILNLES